MGLCIGYRLANSRFSWTLWVSYGEWRIFLVFISYFLSLTLLRTHCRFRGLLLHLLTLNVTHTLTHTHRHKHTHALGISPLIERLARHSDLYLKTHNIHKRHPWPSGIRTLNTSKRAVADLRLRRRVTGISSSCVLQIWSRPSAFQSFPVTTRVTILCWLWQQFVRLSKAPHKAGPEKELDLFHLPSVLTVFP